MKLTLHILWKDISQLWPQLVMPLAALLVATILQATAWTAGFPLLLPVPTVIRVLILLMCMSWVVLIVSLVQTERLVGLNQFWTSRPYEWTTLVGAKLGFVLLFLYAPLVLTQLLLLGCSGLAIAPAIPLLALNLLLFTVVVVLPSLCAAALTRTPLQAAAALLVFASFAGIIASIAAGLSRLAPPWLPSAQLSFAGIGLVSVLAHQYRTRQRSRSLQMLVLLTFVLLASQLAIPGSAVAADAYSASPKKVPLTVRLDVDPSRSVRARASSDKDAQFFIHIPLIDYVASAETSFNVDGHRLILVGQDGYSWQSPWISVSGRIASGQISSHITADSTFPLPPNVYARLRGKRVLVRLEFALTEYQNQEPFITQLSTSDEAIPSLGICRLDASYSQIVCRSAFRAPPEFSAATQRKLGPCTNAEAEVEPATGILGNSGMVSILPSISPIVESRLHLSNMQRPATFCPGAPIRFTERRFLRRLQVTMPETLIHLEDYVSSIQAN